MRFLSNFEGLVDLTSNDYFGFAKTLICKEPFQGATGSRLLTGNSPFYEKLEEKIAHFHGAESCLIFNSGYTANLGLLSAIHEATFIYDLEIHASMIDGMRLSKAKSLPFRHNDLDSLERRLKQVQGQVFVLVESIYSVSGDRAPLKEIGALCLKYGAEIIVDEAHATGVCGDEGKGAAFGLELPIFARIHTFSKALGCHGGCILGSKKLRDHLINFSRPFIYTTALPQPFLSLIEAGYEKMRQEASFHQHRLKTLIHYFQEKMQITHCKTPIQPIYLSGIDKLRTISKKLREEGLDVRPLFFPTTKRGKECLRVVLHSFNQEEEIDQFVKVMQCV